MKKIKLSTPQIELLQEAARPIGTNAVEGFAPRRKLLEFGLIFVETGRYSDTLRATKAGVEHLVELGLMSAPLTEWQRDQLDWMKSTTVTDITSPGQMKKLLERGFVSCDGDPDDEKSTWSITDEGERAVAGYRR